MLRLELRLEYHPVTIPSETFEVSLSSLIPFSVSSLHPGRTMKLFENSLRMSNWHWIQEGRLYKVLRVSDRVTIETVAFMTQRQVEDCHRAITHLKDLVRNEEANGIHGSIFWCALRRRSLGSDFRLPRFARLPADLSSEDLEDALNAADALITGCGAQSCAQLFQCLGIRNKQDCDTITMAALSAWKTGICGSALVAICRTSIITRPGVTP